MAVPVPQGHVDLAIDWATTRDAIIGRWISMISLLLLAGLYFAERRSSTHTHPMRLSQLLAILTQLSCKKDADGCEIPDSGGR